MPGQSVFWNIYSYGLWKAAEPRELLSQTTDILAAPGRSGFQVVDPQRQHRLNHVLVDRLGADLERCLESAHQMLPDLQWRFQLGRQACCRRFGNDVLRRDTLFDAVLEHPVDVVTLPIAQAAEFKL
jgi:hypothetical protein